MADLKKTIELLFLGTDQVSDVTATISSRIDGFAGSIKTSTQPLADLSKGILAMDAAFNALVVGGMAVAVNESSKFNSAFALISTSVSATGADLDKFRSDILDYAAGSAKSLDDITGAIYTAAQAGVDYTESIKFMSQAEELAVANKANLNTTVDLLTGTMAAYGFTVEDVGHLNDVFFASTLIGKQTIDALGQSMGQVVGLAANFGVSFESLSAAVTTLTAKGMQTSEAITAVKGVITAIVSPSREAADAASKLGLDFSASALQGKGFETILSDIMEKTGGSSDKMADLFGNVRALNGAMLLTGDGMEFFNDALNQINNSTGSAEAAYKKMLETFEVQSQMVINSARATLIAVGTELEPAAAKIAGGIADVMKGLNTSVAAGSFDPLFNLIDKFGKDVASTLQNIAKNLPEAMERVDFSRLITAYENLGWSLKAAFEAVLGEIDVSTPEGVADAIQKIVNGITVLTDVTAGIVDGMKPFLSALGSAIDNAEDMSSSTAKLIGNILGFGTGLNQVAGLLQNIIPLFEFLGGAVIINAIGTIASLASKFTVLQTSVSSLGALPFVGWLAAAAAGGYELGNAINSIFPGVGQFTGKIIEASDKLLNWSGMQGKTAEEMEKTEEAFENAKLKAAELRNCHKENTDQAEELRKKIHELTTTVTDIPPGKDITITTTADEASVLQARNYIQYELPDGRVITEYIEADKDSIDKTKKALDEKLPAEKQMELQTQLDTEKIKAQAAIVQASIEWKAKIDIATVEADMKKFVALVDSATEGIKSTGASLDTLFGNYLEADVFKASNIESWIRKEYELRAESFKLQQQLADTQISYLNARTNAMARGDALIRISGDGLQPHLEAFMFEVLSAVQIEATAEGAEFLVGI